MEKTEEQTKEYPKSLRAFYEQIKQGMEVSSLMFMKKPIELDLRLKSSGFSPHCKHEGISFNGFASGEYYKVSFAYLPKYKELIFGGSSRSSRFTLNDPEGIIKEAQEKFPRFSGIEFDIYGFGEEEIKAIEYFESCNRVIIPLPNNCKLGKYDIYITEEN